MTKKLLVSQFSTLVFGVVVMGAVAMALNETLGYSSVLGLLLGAYAHRPLAKLIASKVK